MSRISEDKYKYIIAHLNDRPRVKVARDAGVSRDTVIRMAKKYGGDLNYSRAVPNEYYKSITAQYYATMSSREISDKFNIPYDSVLRWKRRLGLEHDEATVIRLKRKMADALVAANKVGKNHKTWEQRRRLDELRVMSVLPQKTKHTFRKYPRRIYRAIWQLEKYYNYFRDDEVGGLYTMYYDEKTKRTPKENLYIERYGLTFKQA